MIEFNSVTKSKETRNKILGRENIFVSLLFVALLNSIPIYLLNF